MEHKKWYQKNAGWIVLGILMFGSVAISSFGSSTTGQIIPVESSNTANIVESLKTKAPEESSLSGSGSSAVREQVETQKTSQKKASPQSSSGLSNDNYYTNVNGNQIHSPAYSENGSVPAGASAQCRDGTYSFSQNRRGTCSGHGGVAEWL